MRVGVAIPIRDQQRWVETCLTTIRAQTYPCAAYIVDDASVDELPEFLGNRPSWWRRMVRHDTPQGWPASLNHAAQLALDDGCDAVFTMNGDDFLRLDAIERCVRALTTVDAAVPFAQQLGGADIVQASQCPVGLESFIDKTPIVAFGLIRADVWRELGGYAMDVNLPELSAGYNELDFWLRFFQAGYEHALVTDPVVYYRMHAQQLWQATTSRHTECMSLIYRKHPDLGQAAALAEMERKKS